MSRVSEEGGEEREADLSSSRDAFILGEIERLAREAQRDAEENRKRRRTVKLEKERER